MRNFSNIIVQELLTKSAIQQFVFNHIGTGFMSFWKICRAVCYIYVCACVYIIYMFACVCKLFGLMLAFTGKM